MAEIIVEKLNLGYDGKMVVFDLNFSINSGDYLCIVGENGSGKSTLMRTLLGLQKAISGKVYFGDGLKQKEIGYIPQQTDVQRDFPASVYEIVLSGCLNGLGLNPFYTKAQKRMADEKLKLLEISHLKNRCYRELSGGQQQRVLLARALCSTKKVLLLDEPVAGLDPMVTKELYDIIENLNKEKGITIIMVSHDIASAIKYASHILYVSQNSFFGTMEEFVKSGYFNALNSGGDNK